MPNATGELNAPSFLPVTEGAVCLLEASFGHEGEKPRPRVLVVIDHYLPSEKGGGPVWGTANIVERLGDRFEFLVVTSDRDLGDRTPYAKIRRNAWNPVGKASVFYASKLSLGILWRILRDCAPDVLYLNSFFSRASMKAVLLRRILLGRISTALAPHGEFSEGALQLKRVRKRAYLCVARVLSLYRDIRWHAISRLEVAHIQRRMGNDSPVHIAPYLADLTRMQAPASRQRPAKVPGQARFVFVSRISPKKNLLAALEMLQGVEGEISLDIFGPLEDARYWRECMELIERLSRRVSMRYRGSIPHENVLHELSRYDFFLLPTLGENFGGVIWEAMLAGCPVLISDRTPWVNLLAQRVGWDLPLEKPDLWREALRAAVSMDSATYKTFSTAARQFALRWAESPDLERATIELFSKRTP